MSTLRRLLRRAFFVPPALVPLLDLPCALLLAQCLRTGETGPIAHAAYLLSTWALAVTLIAAVRLTSRLRRTYFFIRLSATILRTDPVLSARLALFGGTAFDLVMAAVKLILGAQSRSLWLGTLGVYYLALGVLRWSILRSDRRSPIGRSRENDLRRCRRCGYILLGMNLVLLGVVTQAALSRGSFNYPGPLIYLMALYAFTVNINAAVKLVRFYRRHSPMLTAAKAVSLTAAMVSMLALEVALVDRFGDDEVFRRQMTAVLGGVICAAELAIALTMIVRCSRALKRQNAV